MPRRANRRRVRPGRSHELTLAILPQPDDSTCGPTCLEAVYRYHGDEVPLDRLVVEVTPLSSGGTLAVSLANHALARGYRARIYTYNLVVFDPSWFADAHVDLAERLRAQGEAKPDARMRHATTAYLEFLERGGTLHFEDLTPGLLRGWLRRELPILTGLSATYLYASAREVGGRVLRVDDVRGEPQGHFVVLCGYDAKRRQVLVADPLRDKPHFAGHRYWVPIERVVGAILLGVLTWDANLLVLEPPETPR